MTTVAEPVPSGDGRHIALGLTDAELAMIVEVLGRTPNDLELALYSVMWSEHCSYKSSRVHLSRLPSDGVAVLVGPGEGAGVIDAGDGVAVAIRIESHNHPSFIEPFQGAATGAGGILRDIFSMGARPIALLDPLFIGPLGDPGSRYVLDGVVRGIAGYGNSVGVPTVGGQITFDETYRTNPLVNVFSLGVLPVERLVLGRASGVGNLAVLLGSATGRDGIGGVSVLASAGFSANGDADGVDKRPSVQVGDPFEEKRLIEACLELLDRGLVVGIQDLGGAGLACATSETAGRARLGMDVDVTAVHRREPGMSPIEVMTSESQERMLAIVEPGSLERLEAVCRHWAVEASVVGRVVAASGADGGRLRIRDGADGAVLADVPAESLSDGAPRYHRPAAPPSDRAERLAREDPAGFTPTTTREADLLGLLLDPSWIYRQYDHQLFLNTVLGPGEADAALLRLAGPGVPWRGKGVAVSADANPGWCRVDPREGAASTVAESALNVACAGARPAALVNCLNFGNPEHPPVMWQLSESVDGIAQACRALGIPVVGGNVSLYNESDGADIDPTPVVAVVGLVDRLARRPPSVSWRDGDTLVVLGGPEGALGGSRWARTVAGRPGGSLPPLDLELHRRLVELVAALVAAEAAPGEVPGLVHGLHDVGDGGLALCLAELAVRSGRGCTLGAGLGHAGLFSEAPSRVVVATGEPATLLRRADEAAVPARVIGEVGGSRLVVPGDLDVAVADLDAAYRGRIPVALGEVPFAAGA